MLGFAIPRKTYVLHTNASLHGLGAALYQEEDDHMRVIAYVSRVLLSCERRYPTHKLEFLTLKWVVTDKFADYLYGADFTVMTDNNLLTYILTSAKLDAAGHLWLAALSNFSFSIQYRAIVLECAWMLEGKSGHVKGVSGIRPEQRKLHAHQH